MKQVSLFCIPYAGGSSHVYHSWKEWVHPNVNLIPIELSGRGKRFAEPMVGSMDEAIDDLYRILETRLDDTPFSLFGHSMGGLLAYELSHKIREKIGQEPKHLFISASRPPHLNNNFNRLHLLEDSEFLARISLLGGTPSEALENQELMEIFTPIIKRDYMLFENYRYAPPEELLNCPLTVFTGIHDMTVSYSEALAWKEHTAKECNVLQKNGGHFFIHNITQQIVNTVNSILTDTVNNHEWR
jgi:medium-chain acyl-[acyl-carrier-protein] hydrolase